MKKVLLSLVAVAVLGACSFSRHNEEVYVVDFDEDDTSYLRDINVCPKVHIRKKDVSIVQTAGYQKLFSIEATGYEGFCYFNEKVEKDRAVVKPTFRITRLVDSDVTDVHFSYYLETVEGPVRFLGRKTYFAEAYIPQGVGAVDYTADFGELTIPEPGTYDLDIYLGLNASRYDSEYKSR